MLLSPANKAHSRRTQNEILADLRWAYSATRWFVICYSALATFIILVDNGMGHRPLLTLPLVLLTYLCTGFLAGTVVGIMRPVATRNMKGAMLVGFLATVPVYAGCIIAVMGIRKLADPVFDVGLLIFCAIFGALIGRRVFRDDLKLKNDLKRHGPPR